MPGGGATLRSKVITFLVAITFLLSFGAGAAAADDNFMAFPDTDGFWAEEYIARCAALDLVRGSEGLFRPRDGVTREELVVMIVRTLGLEDEAGRYNAAAYGYARPQAGPWAHGSIVMAAHKGWIGSDLAGVNFREPASRLDMAMIITKALDLPSDSTIISFADLDQIPDAYRPFVAAVVRAGIMGDVSDNLFRPRSGATRAEITTVMSRLMDQGLADPYPGRQLVAELRAAAGGSVTLRTTAGDRTYGLAGFHQAFRARDKVTTGSLVGANVNVVLDKNNRVCFLGYTTAAVSGTPGTGPGETEAPDTDRDYTKAYVVNKYLDYMTVRYDDGTREEVDILSSTRFYDGSRTTTYGAVSRGVRVELVKSGSALTEVRVLDAVRKIFGEVGSVGSSSITVKDADGHQVSLNLADRVRVRDADGNRMALDDISRDKRVEVRLDGDGRADEITLDFRQGDKEGVVTQIRTGHSPRITIEDERGREYTYFIRDDVTVKRDDKSIRLSDVEEGDEVRLWVDRYDDVAEIALLEKDLGREYRGTVTELNLSRKEITIQRGTRIAEYDLDRDVRVRRDGRTLYLDEVLIGAEVELTVSGNRVIALEIIDDGNIWVEGLITRVDAGPGRLTIEQENGAVFRFDFARDAVLRDQRGDRMDIEDLRVDRLVEIDLRDGEIYRLNYI